MRGVYRTCETISGRSWCKSTQRSLPIWILLTDGSASTLSFANSAPLANGARKRLGNLVGNQRMLFDQFARAIGVLLDILT